MGLKMWRVIYQYVDVFVSDKVSEFFETYFTPNDDSNYYITIETLNEAVDKAKSKNPDFDKDEEIIEMIKELTYLAKRHGGFDIQIS